MLLTHFDEGPKTVFFWAPLMKWCLVAAGVNDLKRPAEKLSVSQNLGASSLPLVFPLVPSLASKKLITHHHFIALAGTGTIWVRYSLVITPINYSLAAVSLNQPCPFLASHLTNIPR
jgi:hypothetical protein